MKIFDIGELADRTGVAVSTLRYYDEIGLLSSIGRRGLRRQFGPDAELQVALISLCKKAGFSLTEITAFLADADCRDLPRDALRERADQIDRQIRELGTMRDLLVHVADCPARTHLECPKFRKILKVGGLGP
ncbi:helix-turn-helix domain-containing protein [Limibaculum sp. M0105]|uniref:Helix-turn-helix domain-containing protein n=1 Tax=Thermohalobaculum xanthum TaxID=2753746 RepID=A0A8J7M717_9RHOB|nr:helix-turn-helix domain-containing protein [Thermohalobaculum xanthum]MBK0399022.1 helix-turn-helix domain-containing protein [Thermohalobaculum xanthum]